MRDATHTARRSVRHYYAREVALLAPPTLTTTYPRHLRPVIGPRADFDGTRRPYKQ